MLKGLVFPSVVTEKDKVAACKDAYDKYGYFLDMQSSIAYAATLKQKETLMEQDGSVVLITRNHPGLSESKINNILGKSVELPESLKPLYEKEINKKIIEPNAESVKNILKMYF
jgi:threonine synthase